MMYVYIYIHIDDDDFNLQVHLEDLISSLCTFKRVL